MQLPPSIRTSDLIDQKDFEEAVKLKKSGQFFFIEFAPPRIVAALSRQSEFEVPNPPMILISTDTAEAKLRKHKELQSVDLLSTLLQICINSSEVEIRKSKRPHSIEAYFLFNTKLWLTVLKVTRLGEILVSTIHRVDPRRLSQARKRELLSEYKIAILENHTKS
jgi:hypothetical protein